MSLAEREAARKGLAGGDLTESHVPVRRPRSDARDPFRVAPAAADARAASVPLATLNAAAVRVRARAATGSGGGAGLVSSESLLDNRNRHQTLRVPQSALLFCVHQRHLSQFLSDLLALEKMRMVH